MPTRFSSARHQAALSQPTGYRRFSRLTFFRGGETQDLEPVSGSITQDARRAGRWDGRLTFAGDKWMPRRPGDLLTPFGTRVEVELGLELLDGSVSTVPYGTFEVSSSKTRTEAGQRLVDIGLIDMSDNVERYRFEKPLTIPIDTDLGTMVNTVVTNRTGINPNVPLTGQTFWSEPRIVGLDVETGPWSEVLDMLKGYGLTAWYDRVGQVQVGVINADAGSSYPLDSLTSLSADYGTRPPNVFVARGEPQDGSTPVQAVAMDTDPSSPTYAGTGPGTSPYGRVTQFYASSLLRTVGMAQTVANSLLAQRVGAGATYTMVRPYDPTISAGDVVSLDGTTLIVDSVTLDLAGETTLQVREL
jgi:uncharacterized protein DUF5047